MHFVKLRLKHDENKYFIRGKIIVIKSVNDYKYSSIFAKIYNSANTLFPTDARCEAGEEIFYRQLIEDNNFIYIKKNNICGFVSYRRSTSYYEITSLYVKREYQNKKIGHNLLTFVESQIDKGNYIIIKVLNNASWAFDFYKKHGYKPLNTMQSLINEFNLTEKAWEKILYKDME